MLGWWAQTFTVEYERARGLREEHERPEGYQVGASKTIGVPIAEVWRAWEDRELRERWVPDAGLSLRTATEPRTMRFDWSEGGHVVAYFEEDEKARTRLSVQHLTDSEAAERWKTLWRERVAALEELLEE